MPRKATEKKEKMVTRTVTESMEINVYAFENGVSSLKETITVSEMPTKKVQNALAEKHGCAKVILDVVKENTALYELPVSVFMANAKKVEPKAESDAQDAK